MNGCNSARSGLGFRPYLSSEDGTDDVESGMHLIDFIACSQLPLPLCIAAQMDTKAMLDVPHSMSLQLLFKFLHQF
jgi:hypothetical protein